MARATVFRFKDAADPQEAGRKLGVGAILTGSVSRRGSGLSISAELVETSSGVRLWGEKFERPLDELIRVQDAIASAVAQGLRLDLSEDERRALNLHGTQDPARPTPHLDAQEEELTLARVDWQHGTHAPAAHTFPDPTANPPGRTATDPNLEKRPSELMRDYFTETFQGAHVA
jgi:hypothetical protein